MRGRRQPVHEESRGCGCLLLALVLAVLIVSIAIPLLSSGTW